jgi:predicted nicotinamide N-methyase
MIDMRRVNVELRREALAELEEDVAYRNRVKQRMREGSRCAHPPLIDRKKVLHFAAWPAVTGSSAGSGETPSDPLAQAG